MSDQLQTHVFLSYSQENRDFVESLAMRLQGDARLSFWFGPWHSIPGEPIQEQMEKALWEAQSCAVFISSDQIEGWQNEQMRAAILTRNHWERFIGSGRAYRQTCLGLSEE